MIAVLIGGSAFLRMHAAANAPTAEVTPVPVATVRARRTDSYTIEEHFVGRLEPARETQLAFERGGLVIDILVEEGDPVGRGTLVARLDTAALGAERDRLEAERQALIADLELARLTEARQRDLSAKGHSSTQRHDEARLATRVVIARIGQIDAAIAGIDIEIAKSELRAPFAGTIAARMVDQGAVVEGGAPLVHLLESDRPRARIGLSPQAATALDSGAAYSLRAGSIELDATLVAIRGDLATATRTVPALFDIEDAKRVRFGDIVELAVLRTVGATGFWLPRGALTEGQSGLWDVLVVVEAPAGPTIGREAVEVVHIEGDQVFVRGTLTDQAVVVSGPHRVVPGQRVVALASEAAS